MDRNAPIATPSLISVFLRGPQEFFYDTAVYNVIIRFLNLRVYVERHSEFFGWDILLMIELKNVFLWSQTTNKAI